MRTLEPTGNRESGATLIIITFLMIAILIIVGLVIDFGLARSDKQTSKSAGDFAAAAGLRGLAHPDGIPRPYQGVCDALRYLKANDRDFSDLSGTLGPAQGSTPASVAIPASGDPCTPIRDDQKAIQCVPNDPTTWAAFDGTAGDGRIHVEIKSGYDLDDGNFADESFAPATDKGDPKQGNCDHLAVIISHTRPPGFGSVIGANELTTRTRSVGRVVIGQEADASVALLLLEQKTCNVLDFNGGGSGGEIIVRGTGSRPGMIHADSDGENCGGGEVVIKGFNKSNQPLVRSLAAPNDNTIHGVTSTYARSLGGTNDTKWTNVRSDNDTWVWMCDYEAGGMIIPVSPCDSGPIGGDQITRRPADDRYNSHLQVLRGEAQTIWQHVDDGTLPTYDYGDFAPGNQDPSALDPPSGAYLRYQSIPGASCNANPPVEILDAQAPTKKLYVDCPTLSLGTNRSVTIGVDDTEVVFQGVITLTGSGTLIISNPRRTYLNNSTNVAKAIASSGNVSINRGTSADCLTRQVEDRSATHELVVRRGAMEVVGNGTIQLCSTFVHLVGGNLDLDPKAGSPNYPTPYTNGYNGTFDVGGGGSVQWTAPNTTDDAPGAGDYPFEDLAAWTEASSTSGLRGGGQMDLSGIFVLPNATLSIGGTPGGRIDADAQMWVRRLDHGGNAFFSMRANPEDSIPVPFFEGFELVR